MGLHVYPNSSLSYKTREHGTPGDPDYPHGKGRGGAKGAKPSLPKIIVVEGPAKQVFGKPVTLSEETKAGLTDIRNNASLSKEERTNALYAHLQKTAPELMAQAKELLSHAPAAQAEYREMLQELSRDLGYDFHEIKEGDTRDVFSEDTDMAILGPVKGLKRVSIKAAVDDKGDITNIKDIVRGTITVRSADELGTALAKVVASGGKIVKFKNNVAEPMDTEYRDINMVIRLPKTKVLAEVQLIVRPMLKAKMGPGHGYYEEQRDLPRGTPRWNQLQRLQQVLYGGAWRSTPAIATAVAVLSALAVQKAGG